MKRKSRKTIDRNALPRGVDLAKHSESTEPTCEYCGEPQRAHPIVNPLFPKRQPNKQYLCALDYREQIPGELPFSTRALDARDKDEWQLWWDRRKGD